MTSSASNRRTPPGDDRAPARPAVQRLRGQGSRLRTAVIVAAAVCAVLLATAGGVAVIRALTLSAGKGPAPGHPAAVGSAVAGSAVAGTGRVRPPVASLPKLSAAQLAGQRVIYSYPGLIPPASLLRWIRAGEVGGVIFFSQNISSAAQIASVIA